MLLTSIGVMGVFTPEHEPGWRGGYPKNSGWTNARYQRAALKKRNQQRNRRAHRA